MIKAYFLVNGALYCAFALLCALWQGATARGLGFIELNRSGQSEYLVVYGGLQLGLGLFYFMLSRDNEYFHVGILFSLFLYVPLVAFRLLSLFTFRPTSPITLGTAVLEWIMLIWAWLEWRKFQ
jgi:hypothetical protein